MQSTVNLCQPSPSDKDKETRNGVRPVPRHGDYWAKPELAALKNASYEGLLSFRDLVIGRVSYGEIHFIDSVDPTGLPREPSLVSS